MVAANHSCYLLVTQGWCSFQKTTSYKTENLVWNRSRGDKILAEFFTSCVGLGPPNGILQGYKCQVHTVSRSAVGSADEPATVQFANGAFRTNFQTGN